MFSLTDICLSPASPKKRHPELCCSWTGSVLTTRDQATTSNIQ